MPKSPAGPVVDYEATHPVARRVVRVPRPIYLLHRFFFVDAVDAIAVVYGIVLLFFGWAFKQVGFVFLPPLRRRGRGRRR